MQTTTLPVGPESEKRTADIPGVPIYYLAIDTGNLWYHDGTTWNIVKRVKYNRRATVIRSKSTRAEQSTGTVGLRFKTNELTRFTGITLQQSGYYNAVLEIRVNDTITPYTITGYQQNIVYTGVIPENSQTEFRIISKMLTTLPAPIYSGTIFAVNFDTSIGEQVISNDSIGTLTGTHLLGDVTDLGSTGVQNTGLLMLSNYELRLSTYCLYLEFNTADLGTQKNIVQADNFIVSFTATTITVTYSTIVNGVPDTLIQSFSHGVAPDPTRNNRYYFSVRISNGDTLQFTVNSVVRYTSQNSQTHTGFNTAGNFNFLQLNNILTKFTMDDHPHTIEHAEDPTIFLVYYWAGSPTKKPVLNGRMIVTEGITNQSARVITDIGSTTSVVNERSIFGGASLQRTTLNDDYLVMYYSPGLDSENFTLTTHIYPVASVTGLGYIFSRWQTGVTNSWRLRNDLRLEINTIIPTIFGTSRLLTLDKWQNIALTYNAGNREFIIYLDGTIISRFNIPLGWSPYNTNDLQLGRGVRGYYDNFAMLSDTLPVVKFETQNITITVETEEFTL